MHGVHTADETFRVASLNKRDKNDDVPSFENQLQCVFLRLFSDIHLIGDIGNCGPSLDYLNAREMF